MTSPSCRLTLLAIALALLLVMHSAAAPNKCVFKCVKEVIKCKRERGIPGLLPPGTDCCANYSSCYLDCNPGATSMPPCGMKGKRGSWNKRGMSPVLDLDLSPRSQFDLRQADPYPYLLDDVEDFE